MQEQVNLIKGVKVNGTPYKIDYKNALLNKPFDNSIDAVLWECNNLPIVINSDDPYVSATISSDITIGDYCSSNAITKDLLNKTDICVIINDNTQETIQLPYTLYCQDYGGKNYIFYNNDIAPAMILLDADGFPNLYNYSFQFHLPWAADELNTISMKFIHKEIQAADIKTLPQQLKYQTVFQPLFTCTVDTTKTNTFIMMNPLGLFLSNIDLGQLGLSTFRVDIIKEDNIYQSFYCHVDKNNSDYIFTDNFTDNSVFELDYDANNRDQFSIALNTDIFSNLNDGIYTVEVLVGFTKPITNNELYVFDGHNSFAPAVSVADALNNIMNQFNNFLEVLQTKNIIDQQTNYSSKMYNEYISNAQMPMIEDNN